MSKNHTRNEILAAAVDIGENYRKHELYLAAGDTAWNPTSSKPERAIRGPAWVTYVIHPSSVQVQVHNEFAAYDADAGQWVLSFATPTGVTEVPMEPMAIWRLYRHLESALGTLAWPAVRAEIDDRDYTDEEQRRIDAGAKDVTATGPVTSWSLICPHCGGPCELNVVDTAERWTETTQEVNDVTDKPELHIYYGSTGDYHDFVYATDCCAAPVTLGDLELITD